MPEGAVRRGASRDGRIARVRRWWHSRRVVVHDDSMRPTLRPGDRLLVDLRAFRSGPPSVGDLVLVRDPEVVGRRLLKRVAGVGGDRLADGREVPPGSVYLLGDNLPASRDSRAFGPLPEEALLGRAWHRYGSVDGRRGPLPGPSP